MNNKLVLEKGQAYAWQQSLEKGSKLCTDSGHEGDAETLLDIVEYINNADMVLKKTAKEMQNKDWHRLNREESAICNALELQGYLSVNKPCDGFIGKAL